MGAIQELGRETPIVSIPGEKQQIGLPIQPDITGGGLRRLGSGELLERLPISISATVYPALSEPSSASLYKPNILYSTGKDNKVSQYYGEAGNETSDLGRVDIPRLTDPPSGEYEPTLSQNFTTAQLFGDQTKLTREGKNIGVAELFSDTAGGPSPFPRPSNIPKLGGVLIEQWHHRYSEQDSEESAGLPAHEKLHYITLRYSYGLPPNEALKLTKEFFGIEKDTSLTQENETGTGNSYSGKEISTTGTDYTDPIVQILKLAKALKGGKRERNKVFKELDYEGGDTSDSISPRAAEALEMYTRYIEIGLPVQEALDNTFRHVGGADINLKKRVATYIVLCYPDLEVEIQKHVKGHRTVVETIIIKTSNLRGSNLNKRSALLPKINLEGIDNNSRKEIEEAAGMMKRGGPRGREKKKWNEYAKKGYLDLLSPEANGENMPVNDPRWAEYVLDFYRYNPNTEEGRAEWDNLPDEKKIQFRRLRESLGRTESEKSEEENSFPLGDIPYLTEPENNEKVYSEEPNSKGRFSFTKWLLTGDGRTE